MLAINDLTVMNRMFKKLLQKPVKITYRYVEEPRRLLQSDAAWANVVDQGLREETSEVEKVLSQAGWLVALTSIEVEEGVETIFNLMGWRSHHIDRVCASTLMSETYALSEGLGELRFYQLMWHFGHHGRLSRECGVEGFPWHRLRRCQELVGHLQHLWCQ